VYFLNLFGEDLAEEFTLAPMRRLLSKFSGLKVSERAAEEMRRVVGDYSLKVAKTAVSNALNEGRRTVLDRDVKAAERLFGIGEKKIDLTF
jgi:histone H3/H4